MAKQGSGGTWGMARPGRDVTVTLPAFSRADATGSPVVPSPPAGYSAPVGSSPSAVPGAHAELEQVLAVVAHALAERGLDRRQHRGDGTWTFSRGRTGAGIAIETVSEIVPLWLLPGARKHMFAYAVRVRVREVAATHITLRLDLDRKASASVVDSHFKEALAATHTALVGSGLSPVWGDMTDSAQAS